MKRKHRIDGRMRAGVTSLTLLLLFLISCGDLPKEGSENVEVKVRLEYDNVTTQLGPLIKYMVLDY